MSAEKERRYQEFYKNRFVNPIDQGIGRRTGWVLNKEVRKDSEGFELFDDYWSDSGEESVDDLSLHANKENKGRSYKLSSPISHMPDFTPSSRASTDVEPLSDVGSKTVASNSTLAKTASNVSKVTVSNKAISETTEDAPLPAEAENGVARKEVDAGVDVATPNRDEGGIQESDITGSIIKGGNSFQVPNSVLQEFKTKTRLSFGVDIDEAPGKRSTRLKSSRAVNSHSDDGSTSSDATLTASQTGGESDGHSTSREKLLTDKEMPPAEAQLRTSARMQHTSPELVPSALENTSDKKLPDATADEASCKETSDKEVTATKDSEATKEVPARKNTARKSRQSVKQPPADGSQETTGATKPTMRKRRNVTHLEEDIVTSGDEGMFISLQKSFASHRDGIKETLSDMIKSTLSDQSFQDADDEEVIDIVDDDLSYYKSTSRTKSRRTSKKSARKSVVNKDGSVPVTRSQRGRPKKADKQEVSDKNFVDLISDEEVPNASKEVPQSGKGTSSGKNGTDAEKSMPVQRPKSTRSRKSTARGKPLGGVKSSSDGELGPEGTDIYPKKGKLSKAQKSKTLEQNLTVAGGSDKAGSTETGQENEGSTKSRRRKPRKRAADGRTEDNGSGSGDAVKEKNTDDSKTNRTRNRSLRGKKESHSTDTEIVEQAGPEVVTNHLEIGQEGSHPNKTCQEQILSSKNPAKASTRKSTRAKRSSVHFSSVEVISDEAPAPTDDEEGILTPNSIPPPSHQQTLNDEDDSSPRKKFKRTPGVKLIQRCSTSRRSKDVAEKIDENPQKRTDETGGEDTPATKKQRRPSSSVRGRRKRGGKRKLYSGDLPSSFLNDPSMSITNAGQATADREGSLNASDANHSQGASGKTIVSRSVPSGRNGRGKGRGKTRGKGGARKTQLTREAPQEIEEPDVVLDFLTKYESGKESGSTDSETGSTAAGPPKTGQSEMGDASTSGATPGGMCTTVYPEPTPRSILKGTSSDGVDVRKKNLALRFFEVPRPKAIIMAPDVAENGQRRTKRNRVRPVEFWRNERPEYQRRKSGGFVLVGVQSPAVSSPERQTRRGGKRPRGTRKLARTPANLSMHISPPPGSKMAEHPAMVVINPDTQEEVEVDTLRTSKMNTFVGPSGKEATADDPITLCKSITQKAFSSGILTIRPLSEKGMQFVQNDTMVFYITRGKVSVTIHHTTSILQNGDMFFVPQGNMYNIKNLRRDEAKLVFFQHKGR